jgi:hypothetical protein
MSKTTYLMTTCNRHLNLSFSMFIELYLSCIKFSKVPTNIELYLSCIKFSKVPTNAIGFMNVITLHSIVLYCIVYFP